MRRIAVADELQAQLVKHIDEAYAMEQNVLRMLDGMISTTDDPEIKRELQQHKLETQRHADRMEKRLQAHGASPSVVKEAGGLVGALMKSVLDLARPEKAGRNARDAYAAEHMEIASYELLARIAERAGDEETAAAARELIGEEQAMAKKIERNWDRFAELSLREQGVPV
jgi:ferritin-like metal-binding protein YciE